MIMHKNGALHQISPIVLFCCLPMDWVVFVYSRASCRAVPFCVQALDQHANESYICFCNGNANGKEKLEENAGRKGCQN